MRVDDLGKADLRKFRLWIERFSSLIVFLRRTDMSHGKVESSYPMTSLFGYAFDSAITTVPHPEPRSIMGPSPWESVRASIALYAFLELGMGVIPTLIEVMKIDNTTVMLRAIEMNSIIVPPPF